ncbi:hypothetical protein T4B_9228 [Trichinella pseudospiralis]|uniref:Uncharacterized protein n=1 Tax=Trichinella pseudospiralis TaxID=6337 RepID=A0A0V1GKD6_TRIPS|nr:hypothetical protein T4B_9228 [Trichinella pseudospiralis]
MLGIFPFFRFKPWDVNLQQPAIDDFLRNWIKFPIWESDIYEERPQQIACKFPFILIILYNPFP